MELKAFYEAVGGNAAAVLERFPSEGMVRRFLHKFSADPSYAELKAALEQSDLLTAFRAAHTLKGTSVNLGLETLFLAASDLTEALRGVAQMPQQSLVEAVDDAYQTVLTQLGQLEA